MRDVAALLVAMVLWGCGGGEEPEFRRIPPDVASGGSYYSSNVEVAGDGRVFYQGGARISELEPRVYAGGEVTPLTVPTVGPYRFSVDHEGTPYISSGSQLYRIEGNGTVPVGPPIDLIAWMVRDQAGGIYVHAAAPVGWGVYYLADGASDWAPVTAELDQTGIAPALAADGSLYTYSSAGLIRILPGGAGDEVTWDCNTPEFGFCSGQAVRFVGDGTGPVYVMVDEPSGGKIHRITDGVLAWVADVPAGDGYFRDLEVGPDGRAYYEGSPGNAPSDGYPHIYALEGSSWSRIAELPGPADIAFAPNGDIYAAVALWVTSPGGLWVLER